MAYFDRKDDYGYICWAREVKIRDHYTCVVCGIKGVALHSHHLNAWASYPDQRYDVSNGVTLCTSCHENFHHIYKKGENTEGQFKEFKKITKELVSLAKDDNIIQASTKKMLREVEKDLVIRKILEDLDGYSG